MHKVIAAACAATALWGVAGAAQAQMFIPNPAAYRGDGRFTLAGVRAGITILGVDLDASANLKIGLHDRYPAGTAQPAYAQPAYAQPVAQPTYAQPTSGGYGGGGYGGGYGYAGGGYAYGGYAPASQPSYPQSPCGC